MADSPLKTMRMDLTRLAAVSALALAPACGPPPRAVIVRTLPAPAATPRAQVLLDDLPVDQVIIPTRPVTPIQRSPGSNRITMTATNADVRDLLPALASAAGVSLIMTPDVQGRVSVNLRDVSALEALRAVIDEAGLTVGTSEIPVPYPSVVFYNLPVNVNSASAATIKARYGVSDTVANWIVKGRVW